MSLPKLIAWNCRGAGSNYAIRHLFLLLQKYNPNILILFETRVPSTKIQLILAKCPLDSFVVTEAVGFFGGIWVLWNSSVVDLELVARDEQVLTVLYNNWVVVLGHCQQCMSRLTGFIVRNCGDI